jgi:hypothetical protein
MGFIIRTFPQFRVRLSGELRGFNPILDSGRWFSLIHAFIISNLKRSGSNIGSDRLPVKLLFDPVLLLLPFLRVVSFAQTDGTL